LAEDEYNEYSEQMEDLVYSRNEIENKIEQLK
jgi:hypothetical protein